MTQSGWSHQEL